MESDMNFSVTMVTLITVMVAPLSVNKKSATLVKAELLHLKVFVLPSILLELSSLQMELFNLMEKSSKVLPFLTSLTNYSPMAVPTATRCF